MAIGLDSIMEGLAAQASRASQSIKKKKLAVVIGEVEVTLRLQVELNPESSEPPQRLIEARVDNRKTMPDRLTKLHSRGIAFSSIATRLSPGDTADFTVRMLIVPDDEAEE